MTIPAAFLLHMTTLYDHIKPGQRPPEGKPAKS